jgi:hypothetical protein
MAEPVPDWPEPAPTDVADPDPLEWGGLLARTEDIAASFPDLSTSIGRPSSAVAPVSAMRSPMAVSASQQLTRPNLHGVTLEDCISLIGAGVATDMMDAGYSTVGALVNRLNDNYTAQFGLPSGNVPLRALCLLVPEAGRPSPAETLSPVVRLPSLSSARFILYFPEPETTLVAIQRQFVGCDLALCSVDPLAVYREPIVLRQNSSVVIFAGGDGLGNVCSFGLRTAFGDVDAAPLHREVTTLHKICDGSVVCDVVSRGSQVDDCMRRRPGVLLLCDFAFELGTCRVPPILGCCRPCYPESPTPHPNLTLSCILRFLRTWGRTHPPDRCCNSPVTKRVTLL